MPEKPSMRLSARQLHNWREMALEPRVASRQIATTYQVRGPLDVQRLAAALLAVLARHEQLRLRVTGTPAEPVAILRPVPDTFALPVVDLDGLDEPTRDRLVETYQQRDAATLLDIGTDWPLRTLLLRLSAHQHLLLITAHHLVADGWSVGLIGRDLCTAYRTGTLPPPPVSYLDFVDAEPARRAGAAHRAQLRWWVDQLRDLPPVPRLGTVEGAPTYDVIEWRHDLTPHDRAALRAVARASAASTFAVAVTALAASLGRRTGVWCWPLWVSHAGPRLPDRMHTVGLFSNRLPLVVRLNPRNSLIDAVRQVRAALLDLLDHADLGYIELLEQIPALAGVQLIVQHMPANAVDTADPMLTFRRYRIAASPVQLHLPLYELPDGAMWWAGESRTDVIRPAEAKDLLDTFMADTRALLAAPHAAVEAAMSATAERSTSGV
jgi:hypothetical protein